jgi:transposase
MGKQREKIQLSAEEETALKPLVSKGKHQVREIKHAQKLLKLHEGKKHSATAEVVGVSLTTVYNTHNRYVAGGFRALGEKARPGQPRKVKPEVEAPVTRTACSRAAYLGPSAFC